MRNLMMILSLLTSNVVMAGSAMVNPHVPELIGIGDEIRVVRGFDGGVRVDESLKCMNGPLKSGPGLSVQRQRTYAYTTSEAGRAYDQSALMIFVCQDQSKVLLIQNLNAK